VVASSLGTAVSDASVPSRPQWLEQALADAPDQPGCYLMLDRSGAILYVGKATSVRSRLRTYFQPRTGDTRFFVKLLDDLLGSLEWIVTHNAKEALVLENELIKKHLPRFNVRLKDDKRYLSLRIGAEHTWPRVEVVRRRKRDEARYFGPYDSASSVRKTLRVLNRYFQLRTCSDTEFRNRSRPCLEHQIGRCPAPCVLEVDRVGYGESLDETALFLEGRGGPLLERIRQKMATASDGLDYELAAHYRDQIMAIERSLVSQHVQLRTAEDLDVLALHTEGTEGVAVFLEVREGVLLGSRSHRLDNLATEDEAIINDLLGARYMGTSQPPPLVLVPMELQDGALWREVLSDLRGAEVEVRSPSRGEKMRLMELALTNAKAVHGARRQQQDEAAAALDVLQRRLHLLELPTRIECYDISNIQGTDPTASMVVATDGRIDKGAVRHFTIRGQETPDDYAMMREVLSRRFIHGEELGALPNLVLVDGGKGQLRVAEVVFEELKIERVELASIAKARTIDSRGSLGPNAPARPSSDDPVRSAERLFRPGRKNPVILREGTPALRLIEQLRDEAHRVAITHHRKRRAKRTLTTGLGEISGVGPARQRALLRAFGSLSGVRAADAEQIAELPGFSEVLAARVVMSLNSSDPKATRKRPPE
jgi:excinuclease ABC subunit C